MNLNCVYLNCVYLNCIYLNCASIASRPCGPAGWLVLLLKKVGDVETNPGTATTHKQVWICDICHRQIHGRKQISIWCNMIEHWLHPRCTGIRLVQYTDTWTGLLHKDSRLATYTDITPPNPPKPWPRPPIHSPNTTHTTATQTPTHVLHSPCCCCCCSLPTPFTIASGGVISSRIWSTSQILRPSGQRCSHSGGVCP